MTASPATASQPPAPPPIVPPATIGMLGGGQLGRYALVAARLMGYRTIVLDPAADAPAGAVADEHLVAAFDDPAAVEVLGSRCALVTTEFENPPATTLERLAEMTRVAPAPAAVAVAQDRIAEKRFLVAHGIPVGPFAVLDSDTAVRAMVSAAEVPAGSGGDVVDDRASAVSVAGTEPPGIGGSNSGGSGSAHLFPAVLKTARLGYDGKGQVTVTTPSELDTAWDALGRVPCVLERRLDLTCEVSVVAARTPGGQVVAYDCSENHHVDGILDLTVVPAGVAEGIARQAHTHALAIADALDYVGTIAVEFFVVGDDLLVNEIAPRPHNSGHWTLDAAVTDQFAQQVRAVAGLPLAATEMTAPAAAMVNLLGNLWMAGEPDWAAALADPGVRIHLYGKQRPQPGRKMGHLTATAPDPAAAAEQALAARSRLGERRVASR